MEEIEQDLAAKSALYESSAAEQAVREHSVITLTAEDSKAFADALLAPPAPNKHLRALAERYKCTTNRG